MGTKIAENVSAWIEALQGFTAGDGSLRLQPAADDPDVDRLREAVNACLDLVAAENDRMHASTMELAMGLSECFYVLTEVRRGNLDLEVSDATTASPEETIAKLGQALNDALPQLREIQDLNERQQLTIRELSTPVLQLWDGVIVLPIIGVVDTHRAADIMEKVLRSIGELNARYVIIDLTGVDIVDTKTADYIMKVVRAAQLLGAICLLSGIQPAVAQTLVEVGVDLGGFRTLRNLQAALRTCLKEMQERR